MTAVLHVAAQVERLDEVLSFLNTQLREFPDMIAHEAVIDICAEEIFVNIAHYAYGSESGQAVVECDVDERRAIICFFDEGLPYNPLNKADPDLELSAEERQIGGLGIYMVKIMMDVVAYRRENGRNIFMMTKLADSLLPE